MTRNYRPGGPLRPVSFMVRASNASTYSKESTDFTGDNTLDDVQIQQAINLLPSQGGTVYLSDGTFTTGAAIDATAKKVHLIGAGIGMTTIKLANSVNVNVLSLGNNSYVRDLTIDGNGANNTTGHGVYMNGLDVRVHRCEITACAQNGIYHNGIGRNYITHSNIHTNEGTGLYLATGTDGIIVRGNLIHDNGTVSLANHMYNVYAEGASSVWLEGNYIYQPCGPAGVDRTTGVNVVLQQCAYVVISGGEIFSSPEENILIGGGAGSNSNHIVISGVLFHSASEYDGSDYHIVLGTGAGNFVACFNVLIDGCVFSQPAAYACAGVLIENSNSYNNKYSNGNLDLWQLSTEPKVTLTGSLSTRGGAQILEHHASGDTLLASETGSIHTNLGASGAITINLPQAPVKGAQFEFVVMVAQELRVDPGAAGAVYINGAKQTDDKYISATAINASVKLVADGNLDWVAMYTVGTWSVQT